MSATTIAIPWPRYPALTPRGKPSAAKRAGKPIPWLSANVVNNLPRPVYAQLRGMWRDAAQEASALLAWPWISPAPPAHVSVVLYKRTAQAMDPFAVLEGCKPILDGLVLRGHLAGDDERYVLGGYGVARKSERGWTGVVVTLSGSEFRREPERQAAAE